MEYRKKPVTVNAAQWIGLNLEQIGVFCPCKPEIFAKTYEAVVD